MALLSFIFDRPTRAGFETMNGSEKVLVEMDASIKEDHQRTTTISRNPIEDGSNIADHAIANPEGVTIEGIFSEVPLSLFNSAVGLLGSTASQAAQAALPNLAGALAGDAAALVTGKLGGLLTGHPRDPLVAFSYLDELWKKTEPFTLVTKLKRYDSMLIENLSVPRTVEQGGSLRFTATLRQIRVVSSSIVKIPSFKTDAKGASSEAGLGKQAAKEASAGTENRASLLLQGSQFLGVLQ